MTKAPTPPAILVTVALLALAGAYAAWTAYSRLSLLYGLAGVLAIVACVGAAMLRAWSRFLVYGLAAAFVGRWLYSVYAASHAGYFGFFTAQQIAVNLAPGAFLAILACYCTWAVFRQFRASPRSSAAR